MKCPYRKETILLKTNETERTIEQFEDCYLKQCVCYHNNKCLKVKEGMNMQYQIYKEDTGELVAWIDINTSEQVFMRGYAVKVGADLKVTESVEDTPIKSVGHFEKVTWGEWSKVRGYDPANVFTSTDHYEYEDILLPKRATKGSAGHDFFAPYDIELEPGQTIKVATGIKCKIEMGYVLKEYPRSSLGFKYRLKLNNTVGIIDSDYYNNPDNEGHIFIKMTNEGDQRIVIKKGEAFCQGIFEQFFITDSDGVSAERLGGIGSTNK